MLGSYEQVPPFGFRRKKVFDVVERGVEFRERLYEWTEIMDFQAVKGVGSIHFADGTRCRIHMNSFRKKGGRGSISLFGGNTAFSELARYWYKKKLASLKPPGLAVAESDINELGGALVSASDPDDVSRLECQLTRANEDHLELWKSYLGELDAEYERLRLKQRNSVTMIIVVVFAIIAMISWGLL